MNIDSSRHRAGLLDEIRQRAASDRYGISFEEFMRLALYHPEHGYYSRARHIGKRGDFFTSVSVGPCFGQLLARQVRQISEAWGDPASFCVIEQGAHSGQLARDLLQAWPGLAYRVVEPLPSLRQLQLQTLHDLNPDFRQVSRLEELREANAVFLCNELLDSFPVRRLHFFRNHWEEWRVVPARDGLRLESFPLAATGFEPPPWVPDSAADGWSLEVCPALFPWLESLTAAVDRGVALILDYGLVREERFAPERRMGSLRAYRDHRLIPNLLESPGETDLTWHVDFTEVIEAARRLGWEVAGFTDQARFLTGVAAPWLRTLEGQPNHPLISQFRTLTHPGMMGRAFRVLALAKNSAALALDGFQYQRGLAV